MLPAILRFLIPPFRVLIQVDKIFHPFRSDNMRAIYILENNFIEPKNKKKDSKKFNPIMLVHPFLCP